MLQAFSQDWEGAAPLAAAARGPAAGGEAGGKGAEGAPDDIPGSDVVRPGRFMATLAATKAEVEKGRGPLPGGGERDALLARLSGVQLEAIVVLDDLQRRG